MSGYDFNGLPLTQSVKADSLAAYLHTAMVMKIRKISAYAPIFPNAQMKFGMVKIGLFEDPRDAAYVAMEFNKQYTKDQATQMVVDGTFNEIAKEFVENLEIPEWQHPAEGLSFDEIEGIPADYAMIYSTSAKDAINKVLKEKGLATPKLDEAKKLIEQVEKMHQETGVSYDLIARKVI